MKEIYRNLSLNELRTFITIVESGTFASAGIIVNKTQSAVSQQIQSLEEFLKTELFKRDGRNKVLTNEGKDLYIGAKQILELNDRIINQFLN